jgi:glycosyltransferase involved in cell wall biosynthesis
MSNRFVFVVPCFNAEKTIERMLMSVFLQTYSNWIILIRDDMSQDKTIEKIEDLCIKEGVKHFNTKNNYSSYYFDSKVIVWQNKEKFWEVKNVLAMINSSFVEESDIICRLDGDDFLCNLCALQDVNFAYQETNAECLWTAHRWSDTWQNISDALPIDANVYEYRWVTSHFKTFRKNLITDVNDENFRGIDGEYIKRAGDQAIYLPVLHKSKRRVFLPTVTYYYTINLSPETFKSEDAKFQLEESNFLRKRGYVG